MHASIKMHAFLGIYALRVCNLKNECIFRIACILLKSNNYRYSNRADYLFILLLYHLYLG